MAAHGDDDIFSIGCAFVLERAVRYASNATSSDNNFEIYLRNIYIHIKKVSTKVQWTWVSDMSINLPIPVAHAKEVCNSAHHILNNAGHVAQSRRVVRLPSPAQLLLKVHFANLPSIIQVLVSAQQCCECELNKNVFIYLDMQCKHTYAYPPQHETC